MGPLAGSGVCVCVCVCVCEIKSVSVRMKAEQRLLRVYFPPFVSLTASPQATAAEWIVTSDKAHSLLCVCVCVLALSTDLR